MATYLVAAIEARSVGAEEPFHPGNQIRLRGFHNEMKMIGHEAERMHLPGGFSASLPQSLEERFTVRIVVEYLFAAVAPTHEVVDCAGELNAELSSHGAESNERE